MSNKFADNVDRVYEALYDQIEKEAGPETAFEIAEAFMRFSNSISKLAAARFYQFHAQVEAVAMEIARDYGYEYRSVVDHVCNILNEVPIDSEPVCIIDVPESFCLENEEVFGIFFSTESEESRTVFIAVYPTESAFFAVDCFSENFGKYAPVPEVQPNAHFVYQVITHD